MSNLFLILSFLSFVGLTVGLIKPARLRLKSRKQSLLVFGGATVLLFVLFGATSDFEPVEKVPKNSQVVENTVASPVKEQSSNVAPVTPPKTLTLEEQVTNAINKALGSTNNSDKPTIVRLEVESYKASELKTYGYKPADSVKGVFVVINASENLTTNLQKGSMSGEAADIFQNVFPLSKEIGDIIIWSQLPLDDQYGNSKDGTAIVFAMGRPLSEKVNWDSFNHRDLPTLLKSENRIDSRNNYNELVKF